MPVPIRVRQRQLSRSPTASMPSPFYVTGGAETLSRGVGRLGKALENEAEKEGIDSFWETIYDRDLDFEEALTQAIDGGERNKEALYALVDKAYGEIKAPNQQLQNAKAGRISERKRGIVGLLDGLDSKAEASAYYRHFTIAGREVRQEFQRLRLEQGDNPDWPLLREWLIASYDPIFAEADAVEEDHRLFSQRLVENEYSSLLNVIDNGELRRSGSRADKAKAASKRIENTAEVAWLERRPNALSAFDEHLKTAPLSDDLALNAVEIAYEPEKEWAEKTFKETPELIGPYLEKARKSLLNEAASGGTRTKIYSRREDGFDYTISTLSDWIGAGEEFSSQSVESRKERIDSLIDSDPNIVRETREIERDKLHAKIDRTAAKNLLVTQARNGFELSSISDLRQVYPSLRAADALTALNEAAEIIDEETKLAGREKSEAESEGRILSRLGGDLTVLSNADMNYLWDSDFAQRRGTDRISIIDSLLRNGGVLTNQIGKKLAAGTESKAPAVFNQSWQEFAVLYENHKKALRQSFSKSEWDRVSLLYPVYLDGLTSGDPFSVVHSVLESQENEQFTTEKIDEFHDAFWFTGTEPHDLIRSAFGEEFFDIAFPNHDEGGAPTPQGEDILNYASTITRAYIHLSGGTIDHTALHSFLIGNLQQNFALDDTGAINRDPIETTIAPYGDEALNERFNIGHYWQLQAFAQREGLWRNDHEKVMPDSEFRYQTNLAALAQGKGEYNLQFRDPETGVWVLADHSFTPEPTPLMVEVSTKYIPQIKALLSRPVEEVSPDNRSENAAERIAVETAYQRLLREAVLGNREGVMKLVKEFDLEPFEDEENDGQ